MAERVITAPLAVIRVGGVPIGKMRSIRVRETFQRGTVRGLGQLHKDEIPILGWEGSLSCSFFFVSYRDSQIPGAVLRSAQTLREWADTILLQEEGVQVDILKKVATSAIRNGTQIIQSEYQVIASVVGNFISSHSFDISENSIGGTDQEFEYTTPILFPV